MRVAVSQHKNFFGGEWVDYTHSKLVIAKND
jgi:hypothetical protein